MNSALKAFAAALILAASYAGPATAWTVEDAAEHGGSAAYDGLDAYNRGDYATALRLLRPLADQGNAVAQSLLAQMYFEGNGVPRDDATALRWHLKAANQGFSIDQYSLGVINNGYGIPQDYAAAAMWFRKAADQGDAASQKNLGLLYGLGQGVPQNYILMHIWCNLAAVDVHGQNKGGAEKCRDIAAQHLTPAQIAEAQKLAREWRPSR